MSPAAPLMSRQTSFGEMAERFKAPVLKFAAIDQRKCGRVVEGTGLENQRWATIRGFESHRFRQ